MNDDINIPVLIHALAAFVWFLVPLGFLVTMGKDDELINYHAKQCLYWELLGLGLSLVTCGLWVIVVVVFHIIAAIKTSQGELYTYPISGHWVDKLS